MMSHKLITHLGVRVPPDVRRNFLVKAREYGGASQVLRDLIHAFAEGNITFIPPTPTFKGTVNHVD